MTVDYELLDQRDPRAKPKIIHYNRLKPYRSAWSAGDTPPSPSGQAVPMNTPSPPLLTALSGSRPYVYRHPDTHTCPVSPSQTNVSSSPPGPATATPQAGDIVATGCHSELFPVVQPLMGVRTRSGRCVRPPVRYMHDN